MTIIDMNTSDTFNIITAGYGGQGVLTLAKILARAAFMAGLNVKQAELHGLSQRGGSLACHVRFGKEVYSPLVRAGGADLIIALEAVEALRVCKFANPEKTVVLTNAKFFSPAGFCNCNILCCPQGAMGSRSYNRLNPKSTSSVGTDDLNLGQVVAEIKRYVKSIETIDADKIVRELTGETTSVNIFMLARALGKGVLPLENDIVWQAITETLRERFWDETRMVFDAALEM